ncbi:hypothetical protein FBQ82_13670 [Anaerolineae bacterium CFX7]|nr:hypothetical protein [Anaerolineae bacterium CFX7]
MADNDNAGHPAKQVSAPHHSKRYRKGIAASYKKTAESGANNKLARLRRSGLLKASFALSQNLKKVAVIVGP